MTLPKKWTKEEREAARERAIAAGLGTAIKRGMPKARDLPETSPMAPAPTSTEEFLARERYAPMQAGTPESTESMGFSNPIHGARSFIVRNAPGKVTVYKPTPSGYIPREIPRGMLEMALANGFLPRCPDCNGTHASTSPNACPGRPKLAFRICPIPGCSKRVFDYLFKAPEGAPVEAEEGLVVDTAYSDTTPATRTKTAMDRHIMAYHPGEGLTIGVGVNAPRDESSQAVIRTYMDRGMV